MQRREIVHVHAAKSQIRCKDQLLPSTRNGFDEAHDAETRIPIDVPAKKPKPIMIPQGLHPLGKELWLVIFSFCAAPKFKLVCQRFALWLRPWYSCHFLDPTKLVADAMAQPSVLRTFIFVAPSLDGVSHRLNDLQQAKHMTKVTLNLAKQPGQCLDLAIFARMQSLEDLRLNLSHRSLTIVDAMALAEIKSSRSMHTVHLLLSHNSICNNGATALAEMKSMETLTDLTLDLSSNCISHMGVVALARLKMLPALICLQLSVASNNLVPESGDAIANLADMESLQTLVLDLSNTGLKDDARHLKDFNQSVLLHTLVLRLRNNKMGSAPLCSLAELAELRSLRNLTIDVSSNYIGSRGFDQLASLLKGHFLHSLVLILKGCGLVQPGRAMFAVHQQHMLRVVDINLDFNFLKDDAIQHFSELTSLPGLELLRLSLCDNRLADASNAVAVMSQHAVGLVVEFNC